MIAQTLRRTVRRRPISSLAATTSLAAIGYANYIEWRATVDDDDSTAAEIISRSRYDPDAIAGYWGRRPVSVAKRVANIGYELGWLSGEYSMESHVRPWLRRSWNAGDDATTETKRDERNELESERNLSQKLRSALTRLGPTFVKVGQQLSIRPDLVSPTVLHELQQLCDAVPPFADEIAMRVLAEELSRATGDDATAKPALDGKGVDDAILDVFEEMPELVASASLGQVYRATLRPRREGTESTATDGTAPEAPGERVAIKIQRPDMLATVSLDLFLLVSYGRVVDAACSVLTNQIPYHENFLNGFANGAFMELNYVREAENQIYFRRELRSRFRGGGRPSSDGGSDGFGVLPFLRSRWNGGGGTRLEKVIVPEVHERFTTHCVLVSE